MNCVGYVVVVVAVLAVPGDHFADEAGEEELEAQDYCQEGEVEERLLCYRPECHSVALLDEFLRYDPYGHDSAGQEHEDSSESEEVHRLFAECAEEPQ